MERRSKKEEGNFFLYAKFTIFLVYKVLEDDQSCRLLDSGLFLQAKSSSSNRTSFFFFCYEVKRQRSWVLRGAKLNFLLPKRAYKQEGRRRTCLTFQTCRKNECLVLSVQVRKLGGFFVRALLRMLESNVTVTHYHIAKKNSTPFAVLNYFNQP